MLLFLYRTSHNFPNNKLAMLLMTKRLAMSVSADRSCTLSALPTVPSAVTLLPDLR